jgi:hypothetical protein
LEKKSRKRMNVQRIVDWHEWVAHLHQITRGAW